MLLDRTSIADPKVRQGIDEFLDGLTRQRNSTDLKHQQLLSVCAFCIQLLPPMYQEDKLVDDLRHHLLATGATHVNATGGSRQKSSNLVIQHHLPKGAACSKQKPRSPRRQLQYRLLTDEITRVLQLDASTVQTSLTGQSNLMAGDAIKNLRQQERRQSAQILAARRAKQDAVMDAVQKNFHVRGEDQSLSSDIHQPRTEKKNFVRAATSSTTGASSLFTGVMIQHPPAHPRGELAASQASQAQVVMSKTGRYFKSELKFPRLNK